MRKLKGFTQKWVRILGLWDWLIDEVLVEEIAQDDGSGFQTAASVNTEWEYQHAKIRFDISAIQNWSDKQLEDLIVHELLHVVLNEMNEDDNEKHEERVVTVLTRALMGLNNGK